MGDGEEHFDMSTWAKGHEKLDDIRFKALFSAMGLGIALLVSLCGWSLKANYDNADRAIRAVEQMQYAGTVRPHG